MINRDVTKQYTDAYVTRCVATLVVVVMLIVLFTEHQYLIFFLTIDFAIRAFTYLPSPLAFIAKSASKVFALKSRPVFAPPKKFAAAIGFLFSLSISILVLMSHPTAAAATGSILIVFAFLESAFGICVGCYVYNGFVAPIANKMNHKK